MKFKDFTDTFKDYPIITQAAVGLQPKPAYLRRLITDWLQKGWLLSLKKGFYVVNQAHYRERLSALYIANQIYQPSYISCQSALSYYGMIPEAVFATTSISTRKTSRFQNALGNFIYFNLKVDRFSGFSQRLVNGLPVLIADREKALVDQTYLNLSDFDQATDIAESWRLQNLKALRPSLLKKHALQFNNRKLSRLIDELSAIRMEYN